MYATFLAISTWLWNTVRRQDRRDHPEFLAVTGRYVTGMGVAVVVIFASAFLPVEPRLLVWAGVVIAWIVGMVLVGRSGVGLNRGVPPTDSLVERFGLFTIIVLGEFVFGVVEGLSAAERDDQDDHHRDDRSRDRFRVLVDLLRPGRPKAAAE